MIGNANRHPERKRRIYYRGEESSATSVIDSSLLITSSFPFIPIKHSCVRSE